VRAPPFALILLSLFVCASAHAAPIIRGADAAPAEFPEVYAVSYETGDADAPKSLCTATLIADDMLVTAAHCLPPDPKTPVSVFAGVNAHAPDATYTSVLTARHAAYFSTKDEILQTAFDIGVILLPASIPGATPVALASILDSADRHASRTMPLIAVGYGGKNTIYRDASTGYQRSAPITLVESTSDTLSTNGGTGAISHGDSGGPVFITDAHGNRRLFGIASGSPDSRKLDITGIPTLDLYAGMRPKLACWIEQMAGKSLPHLPGSIGCSGIPYHPSSRFGSH
jgi:V8-like Glu-specific endopeptidase